MRNKKTLLQSEILVYNTTSFNLYKSLTSEQNGYQWPVKVKTNCVLFMYLFLKVVVLFVNKY